MADTAQKLYETFAAALHSALQALAASSEPMRRQLKESDDTLATRAALDAAVGGNSDAQAEEALLRLRADFVALQKKMWVADIEKALEKSPSKAWSLFLLRYVEAFSCWRTQLMWWWADAALGETPENKKTWFKDKTAELRRIQEQSRLLEHGRWPETYPFLRELAENQALAPKLRAHLWTVCGSIQMYYNTLPDARRDLDTAEKLFPELPYLPVCRADLERLTGDFGRSREILEKHLAAYPDDPEAHISLGRVFVEEKNWAEALRCFDAAAAADPGNASAYRNKLSLWGKDEEYFKRNKEKIPAMVQSADRADPESKIPNLLEAGYAYQAGGDAESAAQCFQQAHKADPKRLEPMTALGYLNQTQRRYDKAAGWFKKVLHLAPACVDGYWNMAGLCAEQGKYPEAAEWYKKALPHCPMFTRTLLVKAGEMHIAAEDFENGKHSCLEALKIDPYFDYALNTLHDLSDKLRDKGYEKKTGTEPALEILRAVRGIKGDAYEANFQNRTGNVYYYFADYQHAAEHYRLALTADSSLAVYHDNLAGALDKLSDQTASLPTLAEALQEARFAARLEPSNDNYRQQVARVERKLIALRHFGVLPEERSANILPLRVRFREELYPSLVKDGELVPELMQQIEKLRAKYKEAYGITIPGVRFSTDWNIAPGANFVVDFDGIPVQQGWLDFNSGENGIEMLIAILEQNIQYSLADFIHYDSPEISAKFVGKSSYHAAGFFQVVRVLLKQKINISQIDAIHEIFEAGRASGKHIQGMVQDIRCNPAILPALPVNAVPSRTLTHLTRKQEKYVLSNIAKSHCKESLWQIRPHDPVFFEILDYLFKIEQNVNGHGQFIITQKPETATLLNDLHPGAFFSQGEVLNLTEAEKTEMTSHA